MAAPNPSHASQSTLPSFFRFLNRVLHCENIPVPLIEKELAANQEAVHSTTPVYIYSKQQLKSNIQNYKDAIQAAGMEGRISVFYAVKANANLQLMRTVCSMGCGAVTVSGYELQAALAVGFQPETILLNGNGKQLWEIELALNHGCMLNVDSLFDAENIMDCARRLHKTARVLVRINPGFEQSNLAVNHHYLATASKDSKFGVNLDEFDRVIDLLKGAVLIQLIGLHCHLGSTIRDANLYAAMTRLLLDIRSKLIDQGHEIRYLDIGGGLGIDYYHGADPKQLPLSSAVDLMQCVGAVLPPGVNLIIEPGRSIVASAGVLVTRVLGLKSNRSSGGKHFVVVDAAMNDLIRPSFYQAYHHIVHVEEHSPQVISRDEVYDVVGPVCESGDFLALSRRFDRQPVRGDLLAVMDVGAYGMAMASNYNMRGRATEVLVDGDSWRVIRNREDFAALVRGMPDLS